MIISQTNPEPTDNETSILLVDDDPSILALLEVFVSSYGYDSECATDGEEAVALLKDKEFDIVVTDVMMPKMNGLELLAHIQKYNPGIGVIVVTGFSDSISYTDVIRAGASDFISKPFNRDELEAKLNRPAPKPQVIERTVVEQKPFLSDEKRAKLQAILSEDEE